MKRYLIPILLATTALANAQTYPIVWTDPININGDNSLIKSGGVLAGAWDATIVSQSILPPSTDGYHEFTYSSGTTNAYGKHLKN